MLKEILLTDDERDTILGLCQYQLSRIKSLTIHSIMIRKSACARLGLVICRVKGHVPHDNGSYIRAKWGMKRQGDVWEFNEPTVIPSDGTYDFRKDPDPTLLEDTITPKERRDKLIEKGEWIARIGTRIKPGTSPL